jgi:hypothetical protein
MYKTISNEIIRKFNPCYDPSKYITDENEELPIKDWVEKYRSIVPAKDIIWLLSRKEFLSEKDLILFVVWCAREALKLIENPDKRSVEACDVAEKYANGEATKKELDAAYYAVRDIVDAAYLAANDAYYAATAAETVYVTYYAASTTLAAYYAVRDAAYATRDVSYAAYATRAVSYAARVAYFAFFAANDIVYPDAADAVYNATRSVQLDKLLTYFE